MIKSVLKSFICLLTSLGLLSPLTSKVKLKDEIPKEAYSSGSLLEESRNAVLSLNEERVYQETIIDLSYQVFGTVTSTDYQLQGLRVITASYLNHLYQIRVKILDLEASILVKFTFLDEKIINKHAFFSLLPNQKLSYSDSSLEDAKLRSYQELSYQDLISSEEYQNLTNSLYHNSVTITTKPSFLRASNTYQGTLKWEDDKGDLHPAILTKFEVRWHQKGHLFHQSLNPMTDLEGHFFFSLDSSLIDFNRDIIIYLRTNSTKLSVKAPGMFGNIYEYGYNIKPIVQQGSGLIEMRINMSSNFGKALQILQAGITGNRYFEYLNGRNEIPFCEVVYPDSGSRCRYTKDVIHIISEEPLHQDCPESYAAWDTIIHEYGHHVQEYFNIENNPGGIHFMDENMCDIYKNGHENPDGSYLIPPHSDAEAKSKGLRIAWGEGWAYFFSISATIHFKDQLEGIKYISDSTIDRPDLLSPIELNGIYCMGAGSEVAITSLLFLISSDSDDLSWYTFDTVSISPILMWDSIKALGEVDNMETITPFLLDLSTFYGVTNHTLGLLTGAFGISPSDVRVLRDPYGFTPPAITWSEGGAGFEHFRNTSFTIVIECLVYDATLFISVNDINHYVLNDQEWAHVKRNRGIKNVYVIGSDQNYYPSGPYCSETYHTELIPLSIYQWSYPYKEVYNLKPITETFPINIHDDEFCQVTRLRAGRIDYDYIVLSARQKNAGIAFLEYAFTIPIYELSLELGLWSSAEMLYPHTSTAVVQYKDYFSNTWVTILDLLNEVTLKTDKDLLERYDFTLPYIFEFRIYITSLQSGTNNKGRLCVGTININGGLPW